MTSMPTDLAGETGLPEEPGHKPVLSATQRTRAVILLGALLSFVLFWWAGRIFEIPVHPNHAASMLQQASPAVALSVTAMVLLVSTVLGTLIAGRIHYNSGLLIATLGLTALSIRGGTMRDVLLWANGRWPQRPAIFLKMILELVALFAPIALMWLWLDSSKISWLGRPETEEEKHERSWPHVAAALGVQLVVMAAIMLFLAMSDGKKQVLFSLILAGFFATGIAEAQFARARAGAWYWVGPLLLGVAGYVIAYFHPHDWATGNLQDTFAGWARALPLDYASAGAAGSLLGYWVGAENVGVLLVFTGRAAARGA